MARILGVSLLSAMKYKTKFDQYLEEFRSTDNYQSMVKSLSGMYRVMRSYGEASFKGNTTCLYENLRDKVIDCESRLTGAYIVESTPYFTYNDDYYLEHNFNTLSDDEKLDYIVWMARRMLFEHISSYDKRVKSFNNLSLVNECKKTSYFVNDICKSLGVKSKVVKIPAAFSDDIDLYNGSGFHYFVIVEINGNDYLIDCTYRQFFKVENNIIDRLGVIGLCGCDPGVFMMQNRERKNVALAILKNGWIRCTEDNFKHYLDGFTLSFRNGLYYDWLGQVDYSVGYTVSDYLEFLNGEDYITNYEPREGLGEQAAPMLNKDLRFRFK